MIGVFIKTMELCPRYFWTEPFCEIVGKSLSLLDIKRHKSHFPEMVKTKPKTYLMQSAPRFNSLLSDNCHWSNWSVSIKMCQTAMCKKYGDIVCCSLQKSIVLRLEMTAIEPRGRSNFFLKRPCVQLVSAQVCFFRVKLWFWFNFGS